MQRKGSILTNSLLALAIVGVVGIVVAKFIGSTSAASNSQREMFFAQPAIANYENELRNIPYNSIQVTSSPKAKGVSFKIVIVLKGLLLLMILF